VWCAVSWRTHLRHARVAWVKGKSLRVAMCCGARRASHAPHHWERALIELGDEVRLIPPDFSIALIVGYGLRPSRQRPGHWRGRRWRSPGVRQVRGADVFRPIEGNTTDVDIARHMLAPRLRRPWHAQKPFAREPPSPVSASRLSSRAARASLGAGAVRYSFTVTDFHRLPLAGLSAHPSTPSIRER
jgi:hypothetical protein